MAESGGETRNGRKFRMGLYIILAATAGLATAAMVASIAPLYGTYVSALTAIYAVYCGGNIGNKWVTTRNGGANREQLPAPDTPEDILRGVP